MSSASQPKVVDLAGIATTYNFATTPTTKVSSGNDAASLPARSSSSTEPAQPLHELARLLKELVHLIVVEAAASKQDVASTKPTPDNVPLPARGSRVEVKQVSEV